MIFLFWDVALHMGRVPGPFCRITLMVHSSLEAPKSKAKSCGIVGDG